MTQVNRLPSDAPHNFGGAALDRHKPLHFKLDGRTFNGFAGDTVLTALLANGIDIAGTRDASPIGIDERSAPLVALRGEPQVPMPIDRLPALPGLDLVTPGRPVARGLIARLFSGGAASGNTLGLRLDDQPPAPWLDAKPDAVLEADTLVIGGGVAGLSAARTATGRTILIERRPWLGGDARYFGTTGDEESPDAAIARLQSGLTAEILLSTDVFALTGTRALAHQIRIENGRPTTRVIEIHASKVILATGSFERLPLFAGNRLPGVVGAIAAFHRADRQGVWLGRRALFSTPGGHGYRLALLAKDAGLDVRRIADTRLGPNSRFIDFCKASGVSFTTGLVPRSATAPVKGSGLAVDFAVAIEGIRQETGITETDQFVAGGGLQPELTLWLAAGGRTEWHADRLHAVGTLPGIVLAGAAAGYNSLAASIASGHAAANGTAEQIDDPEIDAIYETPDAPTPVGPAGDRQTPAYLDRGTSFAQRPADADSFRHPYGLSLGELAGAVQIGAIPPALAGRVAAERGVFGGDISGGGWSVPVSPPATEPPAYLGGRFGAKPQLCVVTSADARYFERGCLIFASSSITDPARAIGCITGPAPDRGIGGVALIEREASKGETRLFVRDAGGAVPIERIEKLKR